VLVVLTTRRMDGSLVDVRTDLSASAASVRITC